MRTPSQSALILLALAGCPGPTVDKESDAAVDRSPAPDLAMPDMTCYTPMKCDDQCCDPVCMSIIGPEDCAPTPCTPGYVCDYIGSRCECRNGAWFFIKTFPPPDMSMPPRG